MPTFSKRTTDYSFSVNGLEPDPGSRPCLQGPEGCSRKSRIGCGLKPGMIITCPRCATRYLLEVGVVQPPGRQVRCARCTHSWFQEAAPDLPKPVLLEEPQGPRGPVTDKSRMLPPPPGSISQPIP